MARIPLTKNKFALVDDEDFQELNKYNWYYNGYAVRTVKKGGRRTIHMHREIMSAPKGMLVDHINKDTLDNRKCNLRLATLAENSRNRKMQTNNTSGFRGVSFCAGKWDASLKFFGKSIKLGRFETAEDAARAYDEAAKKHHGEFASLNFP